LSSSNSSITGLTPKFSKKPEPETKTVVQVENLLHDVTDANDDNDVDDATGKLFELVPQSGNRATLVISTSQNLASADDQKGGKIEWPKFRKQSFAVSNY